MVRVTRIDENVVNLAVLVDRYAQGLQPSKRKPEQTFLSEVALLIVREFDQF